MMNYSFPTINPEIWDKYIAPAGLKALETGVNLPVVKQGLEGIEAIHRRGVVPVVSRALEPLPFEWQETGPQEDKAWWDAVGRFQQGRVAPNFDQYITPEGSFSPSGVFEQVQNINPFTNIAAMIGENVNVPMEFEADTMRKQNIDIESQKREAQLGRPLSVRERREVGEDLYKLPPYTRGIAEELPYFAIPPARVMRTGLQTLRTGPRLSSFSTATGAARPLAQPARGVVRGAEIALKPLEVMEEAIARAVVAPFRFAATGIATAINRNQVNGLIERIAIDSNQIRVMSEGIEDVPTQKIVDGANERFKRYTDIDDEVFILQDGVIVRNPDVVIPPRINIRTKAVVDDFERLDAIQAVEQEIPRTAEEAVMGRRPSPPETPAARVPEAVPEAVTPDLVLYRGTKAGVGQVEQGLTDTGVLPFGEGVLHTTPSEQLAKSFGEDVAKYNVNVRPHQIWDMDAPVSSYRDYFGSTRLVQLLAAETQSVSRNLDYYTDEVLDEMFDSLGELYERHVQDEFGSYADTNDILRRNGIKLIKSTDPMEEVGILDTSILDEVVEAVPEAVTPAVAPEPTQLSDDLLLRSVVSDIEGTPRPLTDEQLVRGLTREIDFPERPTAQEVVPEEVTPTVTPSVAPEPTFGIYPPESIQQYQQRRQRGGGAGHTEIEEIAASGLWKKFGRGIPVGDVPDKIARAIKDRNPMSADTYVKLMFSYWDSSYGLRILQDNWVRARHPGGLFRPGSKEDVVGALILAAGAPSRGAYKYTNFIRNDIIPILEMGVKQADIERYLHLKHWPSIQQGARLQNKKLPDVIDPVTGERTSSAEILTWDADLRKRYSKEQYDAIVEGATKVRDEYANMRTRLLDEGIISQRLHDELASAYPWYNPIEYIEFRLENKTMRGNKEISSTRNQQVTSQGIYEFSDNPEVMGALPPLGETMLRKLIQTELRISRNRVTKQVVRMVNEQTQGLKQVSGPGVRASDDKFERIIKKKGQPDEKRLLPVPYNESIDSGYFSYFENGERYVFGGVDGEEIPKWLWDSVNGRAGMAIRGQGEVNTILAASNRYFRGVYTTYNPLFFVRNAVIDMYTALIRAGILPHTTIAKIVESLYKAGTGAENRLLELQQAVGGYQARFYDVDANYRQIAKELSEAGHINNVHVLGKNASPKELDKLLRATAIQTGQGIGGKLKRAIPATGEAIEQAPRLAVMEKSLIKLIGKDEYQRLMKLPREKFQKELLDNWTPKFNVNDEVIPNSQPRGPLVESSELRHAAVNGIDSTINFGRGGDQIRRWNQYVLFLNAAFEGFKLPFRSLGIDLHPDIRPVENPVAGGPQFEFGTDTFAGRGQTGRTLDITGGRKQAAMILGGATVTYWGIQTNWNKREKFNGIPLYYDVPQYVRYNALVFMLPAERDDSGDYILDPQTGRPTPRYIVLPHKLREWNWFMQSATLLDEITDEEVPLDKSKFAGEIWKSTSPISDIPIPEIVNVGVEQYTGMDFWRNAPIVDEELQGMESQEQYDRNTSETIRRISGMMGDANIPEFDIPLGSPQRLEHLYESITGGTGRMVTSMTDYGLRAMDDLRKLEDRPMEQKVEDYRNMDRTSRIEFQTSLSPKEYDEFQKEIRMPRKEIPFWNAMLNSFYPERGGGLRETGRMATEDMFPNVSGEDVEKAGRAMSKVRRELLEQQMESDDKLNSWVEGGTNNVLSPSEWREEKSNKWKRYEGAELAVSQIYHRSIQGQDEETRDRYYQSLYTAAGKMSDMRVGIDLLLAGYYAIEPESSDPSNTEWNQFFADREAYVENIRISSEASGDGLHDEFQRRLSANDTIAEKRYDSARQYLAPYWNIGRNIDDLWPGASQSPQMVEKWNRYLNLDRGRQSQMYDTDKQVQTLVKMRSDLRKQYVMMDYQKNGSPVMDELLVFWYGDFYEGATPQGQAYHRSLYQSQTGAFRPNRPLIPLTP